MLLNCGVEKTFGNPLDGKEIKPVNLKGNQPCIFIGRTDAEAETPIFWSLDVKSQLRMMVKVEGRRRRGNRMGRLYGITDTVRWHQWT